jgi:para-aminobenzoate synthetase component 1
MRKLAAALEAMNEYGGKAIPFLFIVDFDGKSPIVLRLEELDRRGIRYEIHGRGNAEPASAAPPPLFFQADPPSYERYQRAFDLAMRHLQRGDTYLLNLTFPSPIRANYSLHDIFQYSHAPYKLYVPRRFTVFSPETFVRIADGRVHSYPMKGTISADLPDAERLILSDEKEFAEHNTIVDLIRNDLSMVASDVRVEAFRFLQRVHTHRGALLQVSSHISGRLPADHTSRLGDIFRRLLPAGSISGAPKARTVEIIRQAEAYERGFYTGVFGLFDGKCLDSAVMIRYVEQTLGGLVYKSGGGITAMSRPQEEYQELVQKIYVPIARNLAHRTGAGAPFGMAQPALQPSPSDAMGM